MFLNVCPNLADRYNLQPLLHFRSERYQQASEDERRRRRTGVQSSRNGTRAIGFAADLDEADARSGCALAEAVTEGEIHFHSSSG